MTLNVPFIRFFICCFSLFFSFQTSSAQYDDLLNDENITWVAEFTSDHTFSINGDDSKERVKLTKLYTDPSNSNGANTSEWIMDWIYETAKNGQVSCFKDPGLTQALSKDQVIKMITVIDTVTTFDPDTYEEKVIIVQNSIRSKAFKSLRTNQVIFYNKESNNFETRLLAVAPVLERTSKPLFWIEMNEKIADNFNIHSPEITWGALVYSKANPLELNFMEVKKVKDNFDFRTRIYEQAVNQEKQIERASYYGTNSFLSSQEVLDKYSSVDTVITFSPDTYEEAIQIIKNDLSPKEITEYRLMQEWYYDEKKRKLMNRLKAIAPILRVKDDRGIYRFSTPLYYIRYGLDKS